MSMFLRIASSPAGSFIGIGPLIIIIIQGVAGALPSRRRLQSVALIAGQQRGVGAEEESAALRAAGGEQALEGRRGAAQPRRGAHQDQVPPGPREGHVQALHVAHKGRRLRGACAEHDDVPLSSLRGGPDFLSLAALLDALDPRRRSIFLCACYI